MKIHHIDTFPLLYHLPKPYGDANGIKAYRTCYLIRMTTDTGVDGWGECIDWLPTLHKGFHERIIPYLIGKSVADRNQLVQTLKKWHARSASAISMALTEIMAKSCGISICDLWGGKFRDKVPVYASFQSYSTEANWQQISLKGVEKAIYNGFNKIKLKIGGKSISEDQQHISQVQALLQGTIAMALDANESYDMAAAMKWQPLFESWSNLMWLEEPLKTKYIAEYALLRSRLSAPLTGGENTQTVSDFIPFLERHAFDFITPDPQHLSGIDGYRDALVLARSFGIRVTPHTYDGALSRLYAILSQACLEPWSKMGEDSIEPIEWDVMDNPFVKLLPVYPAGGEVQVPSGVGTGVEIDMEMLQYYQWDGSSYH